MITIENAGTPVYVTTPAGEFALTNCGSWHFTDATTLAFNTGAPVDISAHRTGTIIVVDASGRLAITEGPDLTAAATWGFALCIGTLGIIMGVRWTIARIFSAAGIARNID